MNLNFISKKTNQLKKKEINQICKLKDNHWKFGKKNQIEWFNKNIESRDIHNIVLFKSNIIGYTCLRNRPLLLHFKKKTKKKIIYILIL